MTKPEKALVEAWRAWDRAPSNRDAVVRLQGALAPVAATAGVSVVEFRERMAAARRCRLTPGDALAKVLAA